MNAEAVAEQRKALSAPEQVVALNDLIDRTRYSYRHALEKCPAGLPERLPANAGSDAIAATYDALEAVSFTEIVRGLCEPMNGAFPLESTVRLLVRCLAQGAELERRYRVNTGVPAEQT
jgi:hypothetical protein